MALSTKPQRDGADDRAEFIATFCQRTGARQADAHWWFNQFVNHMLDRLINHEKPIDLYFARIHAVLLRPNWRTNFNLNCPRVKAVEGLIANGAFNKLATSGQCLAITPEGTVQRFLEVELCREWLRTVERVELTRQERLGENYAKAILESAKRQVATTAKLCAQYLANWYHPSAQDADGRLAGADRLVPRFTQARERAARRRFFANHSKAALRALAADGKLSGWALRRAGIGKRLPPKKASVPAMRTVQPKNHNVRDASGKFCRSPNGRPEAAGLRVPDGVQELAGRELLAGRANGGETRLAESAQLTP